MVPATLLESVTISATESDITGRKFFACKLRFFSQNIRNIEHGVNERNVFGAYAIRESAILLNITCPDVIEINPSNKSHWLMWQVGQIPNPRLLVWVVEVLHHTPGLYPRQCMEVH